MGKGNEEEIGVILMCVRLVKILLVLGAVLGAVLLARGTWSKKQLGGYIVLTVIVAFVANWAANALPPLTDQVTLTGVGQKREEAVLDEIFLDSYTVDGRSYVPGKSLQIVDGKWFWIGESYVWRNENDSRQPEGVTRSVTVKIPVGWSRTLDFRGGIWRGFVEISAGGETWIADTFQRMRVRYPFPSEEVPHQRLYTIRFIIWCCTQFCFSFGSLRQFL